MTVVVDDAKYAEAWMDTPFCSPRASSAREAFVMSGCAVKTRPGTTLPAEMGPLDQKFGRLVQFDRKTDTAIVRGHDSGISPRFVWQGTVREYLAHWECD